MNDCAGGTGRSLCLYQGFHLLLTIHGKIFIILLPHLAANENIRGCESVVAIAFIAIVFVLGEWPSAVSTCRHLYN